MSDQQHLRRNTCPHDYVIVTYTRRLRDLFRKRYWLNCTECHEDRVEGPFTEPWTPTNLAMIRAQESRQRALKPIRRAPWATADQPLGARSPEVDNE